MQAPMDWCFTVGSLWDLRIVLAILSSDLGRFMK
jgi:hypothetical protein